MVVDDVAGQPRSQSQIYYGAAVLPSDQREVLSCPVVVRHVAQCAPKPGAAAVKLHPLWHPPELVLQPSSRASTQTVRPGAVRAPTARCAQGTDHATRIVRGSRELRKQHADGTNCNRFAVPVHSLRIARQQRRNARNAPMNAQQHFPSQPVVGPTHAWPPWRSVWRGPNRLARRPDSGGLAHRNRAAKPVDQNAGTAATEPPVVRCSVPHRHWCRGTGQDAQRRELQAPTHKLTQPHRLPRSAAGARTAASASAVAVCGRQRFASTEPWPPGGRLLHRSPCLCVFAPSPAASFRPVVCCPPCSYQRQRFLSLSLSLVAAGRIFWTMRSTPVHECCFW